MSGRYHLAGSTVCGLIALAVLAVFMAWQCVTQPVVEMGGRWIHNPTEAEAALRWVPVERVPTPVEVAVRIATCTASLLFGAASFGDCVPSRALSCEISQRTSLAMAD